MYRYIPVVKVVLYVPLTQQVNMDLDSSTHQRLSIQPQHDKREGQCMMVPGHRSQEATNLDRFTKLYTKGSLDKASMILHYLGLPAPYPVNEG
jgi:hypothetical protein